MKRTQSKKYLKLPTIPLCISISKKQDTGKFCLQQQQNNARAKRFNFSEYLYCHFSMTFSGKELWNDSFDRMRHDCSTLHSVPDKFIHTYECLLRRIWNFLQRTPDDQITFVTSVWILLRLRLMKVARMWWFRGFLWNDGSQFLSNFFTEM